MLEPLKQSVLQANLDLVKHQLVIFTWGNVSQRDADTGLVVIKPSGVDYQTMVATDMVVVDIEGNIIEGHYKPSSDLATHLALYRQYPEVMGIVHTHSEWATAWAQAGRALPCYGTTHADYFYGEIPCTRPLTDDEVADQYEYNTGKVIIETITQMGYNVTDIPGIIISGHGPFTWGKSAENAVHNAKVLEEIAKMAYHTEAINPKALAIEQYLLDKHYLRKHGKNAYYGQRDKE